MSIARVVLMLMVIGAARPAPSIALDSVGHWAGIDARIAEYAEEVAAWRATLIRVVALNTLVVVLGATVGALHSARGRRARLCAATMGVAISALTGINNLVYPG